MTDVHRNVVQLVLSQGLFRESELLDLLARCIDTHKQEAKRARLKYNADDHDTNLKTLSSVVDVANEKLLPLGMKIARMKSKAHGQADTYYGVVDLNTDDAFSKFANPLSTAEQEFFHKLVSAILASGNKAIESDEVHGLVNELTTSRLGRGEIKELLERLEREGWLVESDDGSSYSLGVRTELQRRYINTDEVEPEAPE